MNMVVMGAQWGDEGKGKIVDYLCEKAKYVVRYAGGANAGHTIVRDKGEYALHLVPSGILYPDKTVYLGTGMVIDPEALFKELDELKGRGIDWEGRVFISERAHIVLPRYRAMDRERDSHRKQPIGTTGRGIGTTYSQKCERDGIRIIDLASPTMMAKLEDEDVKWLSQYKERLLSMKVDLTRTMAGLKKERVLMEGAQGAMLDLDSGTYPFVSSGASCASGAAIGAGIGPRAIDKVLGVFKAYTTRVGNGPMPTEFNDTSEDKLCKYIRDTGREYGVTTGRPRRCGYLDLVALRYACRCNSIDSLVLTHLDIYDGFDTIEACVAYDIDGRRVEDFPASIDELYKARPILQSFTGWKEDISRLKCYDDMSSGARDYVKFIEEYTGIRVGIVSVGALRELTFLRDDPWQL